MDQVQREVVVPPSDVPGVRYVPLRVKSLLRQQAREDGSWHWRLDPYEGCQFACTHCPVRLERLQPAHWREFESRIAVKVNAAQVLREELRTEDFNGHQIALGEHAEAWQQVEEHARLTRALLSVLAGEQGLDIRITTRSSLIARDGDLLTSVAAQNRVSITFALPSLDERINRLVEPRAPSAFRRLAAMEGLARLGLQVGVWVAPVLPGLDDDELQLKALLTRAANAGARFAGIRWLAFDPAQRDNFLRQVTAAYPEAAARFRRVIGRRAPDAEALRSLERGFDLLCRSLGLHPLAEAQAPRPPRARQATQLALFGA
jgi:DNA repair photolyase